MLRWIPGDGDDPGGYAGIVWFRQHSWPHIPEIHMGSCRLKPNWVRRGIKEAIWERVEQPSLNRKGGLRFSFSNKWDQVLRRSPSSLSRDLSRSRDLQHSLMKAMVYGRNVLCFNTLFPVKDLIP